MKTPNDIKKGLLKEPDEMMRLEEEDLIKMNLNDAICVESEDEEDEFDAEEEKIGDQHIDFVDI